MRASRVEWAKRVEQWKRSGMTAKEFAAEFGCNPRSLVFWKWQLGKDAARRGPATLPTRMSSPSTALLPLIEVSPPVSPSSFELEFGGGRRLIIPATFEAEALRRLLSVLEGRS